MNMLTEKVNSAITDQMIAEVKYRLRIGDIIEVIRWDGWKNQQGKRDIYIKRERCPIIAMYPYHFLVRLEGGLLESFTWIDLFRQYGVKIVVMTDRERSRYTDLVKDRANIIMKSSVNLKPRYKRKIQAIDKELDALTALMDQTWRLCG